MLGYYLDLALHSLKRGKALAAMMVMALAVGIGASMTTLTVAHLLSGDPVPGHSATLYHPQLNPTMPPRLVHEPTSAMDYRSAMDLWSAHRADRQTLVASSPVKVRVEGSGEPPLPRQVLLTTSDFFPMFDVPFRYGGPWAPTDEGPHARVVVISSTLNEQLFGGANSVGRSLRLRDSDVRIVGVMAPWRPAPRFYDIWQGRYRHGNTESFYNDPEDIYTPVATGLDIFAGQVPGVPVHFCWDMGVDGKSMQTAPCAWLSLWVQLSSPAKVHNYAEFLKGYAQQQKRLGRYTSDQTRLQSLMQWLEWNRVVPGTVRMQAWMAQAFLLICLVNTVGLLLTRFLRRSGEIGVRRAMGASRRAVFTQCLVEAGLIGLLGGVGGWLLTLLGLWMVRQQPVAYADLAHLDLPMFFGTFAMSLAASLLAGVLPALRASRVPIGFQLKTL
ncbi:MAG: FtsX-like permease family protein [Rhodanobacter sp.]|nr:MAG: FtsX-like permease family protein [Rhodanobacter sp.]